MLYEYLKSTFPPDTPIMTRDVSYSGSSPAYVAGQLARLAKEGKLKRYSRGIYFIPSPSPFKSGSTIPEGKILEGLYLVEDGRKIGYITGLGFANSMGITTQVPVVYELASNKATRDVRSLKVGNKRIIVRKPRAEVTEENWKILQVMDLIMNLEMFAEDGELPAGKRILAYMRQMGISMGSMDEYLGDYPERIYKNLYKAGLIHG